jgi:hypothetical protein
MSQFWLLSKNKFSCVHYYPLESQKNDDFRSFKAAEVDTLVKWGFLQGNTVVYMDFVSQPWDTSDLV